MVCRRFSIERWAAFRSNAFDFARAISIGLRSGEWGAGNPDVQLL
jgi:hypothetical protein